MTEPQLVTDAEAQKWLVTGCPAVRREGDAAMLRLVATRAAVIEALERATKHIQADPCPPEDIEPDCLGENLALLAELHGEEQL